MTQKGQRSRKMGTTKTNFKMTRLQFPNHTNLSEYVAVDGLICVRPAVDELEEVHARAVLLHHELPKRVES